MLLVACAVGVGAHVVSRAEQRTQVLAFARDLAAGTTVEPDDVGFVRVGLPERQASVYVSGTAAVRGMRLGRAVVRGELVTRAVVSSPQPSTTIVVPLASGAAPALHRGQRIVVWAVTSSCGFAELVPDVTVQSVDRGDEGLAAAGQQRVVVDLADDVAVKVVEALSRDGVVLRAGVVEGEARKPVPNPPRCHSASG